MSNAAKTSKPATLSADDSRVLALVAQINAGLRARVELVEETSSMDAEFAALRAESAALQARAAAVLSR